MRSALIIAHTTREQIRRMTAIVAQDLHRAGFEVRMLADEMRVCGSPHVTVVDEEHAAEDAEMVLVFGGDGTFLRAAEFARPAGVPMLGVNLGRVGFLAEAEADHLPETIRSIVERRYGVEERTTIDVEVSVQGDVLATNWALNEASVEKSTRERMLDLAVAIDGRPLLRFGCDGVLCATPTGSTAYAYSAGGPIVWPDVDALLVVPNAAHALFARPVVVAPHSIIDVDLIGADHAGVLGCDGRRSVDIPPGGRVTVRRGVLPIRIARLSAWSFAERLVTKFQLPVRGFRDGARTGRPDDSARTSPDEDAASPLFPSTTED
ncbi:MAG: NAD kinase [Actinomycetota bacterium]